MAKDDADCLDMIAQRFRKLPAPAPAPQSRAPPAKIRRDDLYACCRPIIACPTDRRSDRAHLRSRRFLEFQPEYAPEMLCANARLSGHPGGRDRQPPRISETEGRRASAASSTPSRRARWRTSSKRRALGTPADLLAGCFRLHGGRGSRARGHHSRGRRDGGDHVVRHVPKIVLTINHASGAGYYAMAGQGFDPNFTFSWPTARIGVMEGDSAVQALSHGPELEKLKRKGGRPDELKERIEKTRADYERWLDAKYAAARGHVRRADRSAGNAPKCWPRARSAALAARTAAPANSVWRLCMIRIANGQGFWGDWLEAPVRLVEQGPIDYLALDYLAEVTMSILQKQRQPTRTWATRAIPRR
jgi:3-methylcrotonyl-CoA carboxylase beta subunit